MVWQCQFFTHGSKIDIETSFQFSLECPSDVIKIEGTLYYIYISWIPIGSINWGSINWGQLIGVN